jgi:hypothetical protein
MRKAWHLRGWMILLGIVLAAVTGFSQVVRYTIDPNGDESPSAVKDLQLTFRPNTVDIIAPDVLITPDGSLGFATYLRSAAHPGQGYVLVFHPEAEDPASRIVTAIPTGQFPGLMFFNPDRTEIWITDMGDWGKVPRPGQDTKNKIIILDVNTLTVKATILAPDYMFGFGSNIIFSLDGSTAFISSTYTDDILKIDTTTYQFTQSLHLIAANPYYYTSVGPAWLTLSNDGAFLCSTNTFNATVSVVDTANLTEIHQVIFRDSTTGLHIPNFTFRNNVLLNEDGTIGFIASIGTSSVFGVMDRVYEFDPVTGLKLKDEEDNDIYLSVSENPSQLMLDPTGEFLIVQVTSYDKVDTLGNQLYGYPELDIFKWPTLELYKMQQFRSPPYNMARTSQFAFVPNGDGTYDIMFPSFSTYDQTSIFYYDDLLVRVPIQLYQSTSSLGILDTPLDLDMPVAVVAIPNTSDFLVANFMQATLSVVSTPPTPDFSSVISMYLETGHFSSLALLNRQAEPVTYSLQSYQTNNTLNTDDDTNAGTPFFYVDDQSQLVVIEPYDVTLQPGQQLVTMFLDLVPDYDKVINQHGFTKAVNPTLPLEGIGFNGVYDDAGTLVQGDYFKINHPMYQDAILPFLYSTGDIQTVIHYVNPYYNQTRVNRIVYGDTGTPLDVYNVNFTVPAVSGIDQVLDTIPLDGYVRLFNTDNLNTDAYMTVDNIQADGQFLFTCPPLNPYPATSTQSYYLPYYAVGQSYDTSVILISTNPATDPDIVDDEGNPITLTTHVHFDFYNLQGQWMDSKDFDFDNMSRFEKYFSAEDMLNVDRFGETIATGSVVITLDRDNVCGVYTYSQWNPFDPDEDPPLHPFRHIYNMTVDELPLAESAADSLIFPFTIHIAPFDTSYALYNPGDETATVRVELYQSDGTLVAVSPVDIPIEPKATFLFFLGDPAVFGDVGGLDNFVGYMKVAGTNGQPFFGKSIQSSPEMMAIIPTL